jgi:hypothetical protein
MLALERIANIVCPQHFDSETRRRGMNCVLQRSWIISVAMVTGVLVILTGCAPGLYGWRPDQAQVDPTGDPYKEYVKVRQFAIELTEAYDSRSSFNRGTIYAGTTTLLGLTAASSGLAAFGAAATGAGKSLPVVGTFINGLTSIFDSRQLAQLYTTGANKLRRTVSDSDGAFLQEPTIGGKWRNITTLQEKALDIMSEVEEARNSVLPDPRKVVERAVKAKDEVEEALSIKPKITNVTPRVVSLNGFPGVRILGSGFDSSTTLTLNGFPVQPRFVSEGEIQFNVTQVTEAKDYIIVVRNRFNREAGSPVTFVQANVAVRNCKLVERTKDVMKHVVILIEGTGFQEDGSIDVEAKADSAIVGVKARTWRAHTQWEIQLDNSTPDKSIAISKVAVTNMRDGGKTEWVTGALPGCVIPRA